MQFAYPTTSSLIQIEREKRPILRRTPVIDALFPEDSQEGWVIAWDQYDNIAGLMQPRGLNNAPLPVKPVGFREMTQVPGVYSDMLLIDERKLTTARRAGSYNAPVDVSDLVTEGSDQLATRDFSRIDYLCWTLLQTGSYQAVDRRGVVTHQIQYTPQVYNAAVAWGTVATATPIADFRTIANLGGLGTDAVFDASATAYMTRAKWNQAISNTNSADLGGKRDAYGQTYNDLGQVNRLLMEQDLPQVQIVQDGYFDEVTQQFAKYLQDGKVVVVGRRPSGAAVGSFVFAKNVNNDNGAAGRYFKINDLGIDAAGPRRIELHRGWNAAAIVKYPRMVYVINA